MKERKRLGLALCGSYCTYEKVLKEAEKLAADWDITAVMSETAACTDSRFGKAEDFIARLEELTGCDVRRPSQAPVFYMAVLFFKEVEGSLLLMGS